MPELIKKDFTILYGSQTGQAQAISEELFDRCFKEGFNPVRYCVSQVEKKFSIEKESCIVVVCSTTGEGDPPESALKFFRRIKKKTLPSTYLENLSYAILGLGDSNYTNFCNASKTLESRLVALGAKSFYPTGYADDGVGLEIVVEPWIEGLFPALRKYLGKNNELEEVNNALNIALNENIVESNISDGINNSHIVEVKNGHNDEIKNGYVDGVKNDHIDEVRNGDVDEKKLKAMAEISEAEVAEEIKPSLKYSIPPLCDSALKVPSLPAAYLQLKFINDEEVNHCSFQYPSAATGVKEATITSARQLTNDSQVKKALELELDVTDIGFDFQPGDSFGIVCENKKDEIDYLIQRLKIEDIADKLVTLDIMTDTLKKAPSVPKHIRCPSTLRTIFTKDVDFRAVPRKAFLRMLVEYTEKESEKRRLQELCSTQGATDYSCYVRENYVGLLQLLQVFQSCSPPVERVLEMLPQLQPREYSAASSPYQNPNRVKFVFNVMKLPEFQLNKRFGLCTFWLDSITESMRNSTTLDEKIKNIKLDDLKVKMYFRQPTPFRFPEDPSQPLIMIGPGTGVAPYIGFLEQREFMKRQNPEIELGTALLFYGCRYKNKDFLYRDELKAFQDSGILTTLYTSFSRDQPTDEEHTKYVQDNIRRNSKHVLDLIFEYNGAVFICGDAKHMGRDVTNTFIELIEKFKNVDKIEAIKLVNELREKRQFLEDTWS